MINLPSSVCHAFEADKDYLFILRRRQMIKQFKLFPTLVISIMAVFMISDSYLSAAETFWDDFDGSSLDPGQIRGQDLYPYILIDEASFAIPDELLTLRMNFRASTSDWPLAWSWGLPTEDSSMKPASNSADDIVSYYDVDYIDTMRIPAPASVVLVALGLLSLRYTRRFSY